ncbi:MAG TPA: hypothetical protein VFM87_05840, partial [Agrococcus sp.]|nr:hypothetical protein [Agrococcus sp.]
IDTRRTRMAAFVAAGAISGFVGVYTVAQFASARPDAGTSGGGMALPAITIAVLGGVAITGGIGRLSGVLLAALLIVWLNASILLVVPGNAGAQAQLLALGLVLLGAALLGQFTLRRKRQAPPPTTVTTPLVTRGSTGARSTDTDGDAAPGSTQASTPVSAPDPTPGSTPDPSPGSTPGSAPDPSSGPKQP